MQSFNLNGDAHIGLDKLLKVLRLAESGGEAHNIIDSGLVKVNGTVENQRRKKLRHGDVVLYNNETIRIE